MTRPRACPPRCCACLACSMSCENGSCAVAAAPLVPAAAAACAEGAAPSSSFTAAAFFPRFGANCGGGAAVSYAARGRAKRVCDPLVRWEHRGSIPKARYHLREMGTPGQHTKGKVPLERWEHRGSIPKARYHGRGFRAGARQDGCLEESRVHTFRGFSSFPARWEYNQMPWSREQG